MKTKIDGLEVIHKERYLKEVNILKFIFKDIVSLVNKLWGFEKKSKIVVYITKSSTKFIFYTLPTYKKILLLLIFPIWYISTKKHLPRWGGITYKRDNINFIMAKPIEVYSNIESGIGKMVYKRIRKNETIYKISICLCIVDTFSSSFRLPLWIKEGIKIVTIEKIIGKQLVKNDSLFLLKEKTGQTINCITINEKDNDIMLAYNYVKGYWTVRYLEENYPGFLKETFKEYKGEEIVEQIRLKLGLNHESFWEKLDELLYESYKHLLQN